MSSDPHCRECLCSFELSLKNKWKALCLDCAEEKRHRSIDSREAALDSLKEKVSKLERENENLRSSHCLGYCHPREEYNQMRYDLHIQINSLSEKVRSLMKENEALRASSSRINEKPASNSVLKDLETKEACIRSLSTSMSSLTSEVATLKKQLQAAQAEKKKEHSSLLSKIEDQTKSIARLNSLISWYQEEVARVELDHDNLQTVVFQKSRDVEKLEKKAQEAEERLQNRAREAEERMIEKDRARRQELTNLHNAIARKLSRIRELENEVEGLESELKQERWNKNFYKVEFLRWSNEVDCLEAGKRTLEANLQSSRSIAAERSLRLEESRAEVADLKLKAEQHKAVCPADGNKAMLDDSLYTDICISVGEEVIHVHRGVLASRSPVFASMFRSPMRESTERLIQIEDMSPQALKHFIHFLYTGRLDPTSLPQDIFSEVEAASHKFNVLGLAEGLANLGLCH